MPETPFGPLESLVGRTFERDGEMRTVVDVGIKVPAIDSRHWMQRAPASIECRYRLTVQGDDTILVQSDQGAFLAWLSGAKEVKPCS